MFEVVNTLKIGDKLSVTLQGSCVGLKNALSKD